MSRAAVWHTRRADASWRPVGVFLGTSTRLDGRVLPGDPGRERWFQSMLDGAKRPTLRDYEPTLGTWEDWIGWALTGLSNGHDSMLVEVDPEPTADMLYAREVLGTKPQMPTVPGAEVSDEVPSGLGGFRAKDLRPAGPGGGPS